MSGEGSGWKRINDKFWRVKLRLDGVIGLRVDLETPLIGFETVDGELITVEADPIKLATVLRALEWALRASQWVDRFDEDNVEETSRLEHWRSRQRERASKRLKSALEQQIDAAPGAPVASASKQLLARSAERLSDWMRGELDPYKQAQGVRDLGLGFASGGQVEELAVIVERAREIERDFPSLMKPVREQLEEKLAELRAGAGGRRG